MKPLSDSLEPFNKLCKKTTSNCPLLLVINVLVMSRGSSNILPIMIFRENDCWSSLLEGERHWCYSSLRQTRHDQWHSNGGEFDRVVVRCQTSLIQFPRSVVNSQFYSFDTQKMYNREMINGMEMYTLTAYFVNPGRLET